MIDRKKLENLTDARLTIYELGIDAPNIEVFFNKIILENDETTYNLLLNQDLITRQNLQNIKAQEKAKSDKKNIAKQYLESIDTSNISSLDLNEVIGKLVDFIL